MPPRTRSAMRSGSVKRPDHHDRLVGGLAGAARPLHLVALVEEPRRARVEPARAPHRADHDVPQVDHVVGGADERQPFLHSARPIARACRRRSHGDRDVVADRLLDQLDRLQPEARAVLERAAVLVAAVVVDRRQELGGQVRVRAVRRRRCRSRRRAPRVAAATHCAWARRMSSRSIALWHHHAVEVAADLRRRQLRQPRLAALGIRPAVPQLDPGQGAVLVGGVGHQRRRRRRRHLPMAVLLYW